MTVVIGTAGHIDHGKTSLLRALTGIDADRLPEEQRRGMTIDVGYAHLRMDDGSELDFVDVPGHDRLIGNMLVGAGEMDAALLVVAADDGPRAQTLEHLELLGALGINLGLVVMTKIDMVAPERRVEVMARVRDLLAATPLRHAAVLGASSTTGEGLAEVRVELAAVQAAVLARPGFGRGPVRLAIDRAFSVRGRGLVVTGSLRGGALTRNDNLRAEPSGLAVRIREIQVHHRKVERVEGGGRVALNLAGVQIDALRRGDVLTVGPGVERSDRVLVLLEPRAGQSLRHGLRVRLHSGTEQVEGTLDLSRRAGVVVGAATTAIIRLDRAVAAAFDDRFVLRRPSPAETLAGGRILDPLPPRGVARQRMDATSLARLATAEPGSPDAIRALITLHGALPEVRVAVWSAASGGRVPDPAHGVGHHFLAEDVRTALESVSVQSVDAAGGMGLAELRVAGSADIRHRVTLDRPSAELVIDGLLDGLVSRGRLVRDGDRVLPHGSAGGPDPGLLAAMDRLVASLAVAAPPSLREAALAARCPIDGIRALEAAGRIIRVEDDLAWEGATLRAFEALAVRLAAVGPLAPASFRDATGTSRRYALAILEDLDRRAVLRRTPAGHVPGPRAGSVQSTAPAG